MWRASYRNKIQAETPRFNVLTRKLEELQNEVDLSILGRADVIGMTTTGAARCRNVLNRLPINVVVVEEAAEVLEAHIITSMPKFTEHLILIGDHQQLKPSPNVYELATKMNLDISLFERLVRNNLPYAKLTCQHRMRPRIADLIRPHIYETLTDNKNVKEYEDIWGVDKSVFFISHQHKKDMIVDGKTKINQHEAEFIVALCKYLLLQQYKPSQITILTTYTGQLLALKNIINQHGVELKDVYVTAVDNYQGEENDIILLSLVRSNESRSIGFLKIHNRVCVALSRAKKGLFCIGNMKLLQKESDVWDTIVKSLEEDQLIGSGLTLKCRNHPDTCVLAEYAKDFKKFPEGGCGVACLYRLNCGHSCTRTCHPDDRDHSKFRCMKPCTRSCPLLHRCLKRCLDNCGICPVIMDKKMPECGHVQRMKCGIEPEDFQCQMPCPIILDCGHQCMNLCGSPCGPCKKVVIKTIPECGHIQDMECNVNPIWFWCKSPCKKTFACGHKCPNKCGKSCWDCLVKVEKTLPICGHQQMIECHINPMFFKCKAVCEKKLSCGHQCGGLCSQECPDCQVLVNKKLGCGHDQRLMCSQDVNTVKCLSRCKKTLACGHQCVEECWNDVCTKVCLVKVKVNLSCGHEEYVSCIASSNRSKIFCKKLCGKTLDCGHKCKGPSLQLSSRPISHEVPDEVFEETGPSTDTCVMDCA